MAVGISFGSATSGTGFDVATTVASIMTVERTPETAWATQTTALQAQDTVLSTLGTNMSALSTALSSLTNFDGVFSTNTGATSDSSTVALTTVGSTAAAGTHTLTVTNIAATSKQYSSAVASTATLGGTLKLTVGSGTANSLTISAGSTVAQVAAQINASSAGVAASVVTDSNGSHLSLVSGTSGAAGELTVDSSGVTASSGGALSFTESTPGVDAAYTLDGISLTSSSNKISTALTGATFQLLAPTSTGSSVLLEIEPDTSSVSTTLSTFVSAYNTLIKALAAQEANDSTGTAQPLFGSPVISQLQSSLSSALSFTSSSTSTSTTPISLVSLGITTGTDGTLTLDTSALSSALSANLSGVESFFQSAGNFGQNLSTALINLGSSGTGALALATANNSTQETELATNKTNLEARLGTYETDLTTELTTANQILQSIPTTLKGITALFDAITGNTSS